MRFLLNLIDCTSVAVNRVAVLISEIALFALMMITSYAVIARYVFLSPSIYAVEVSTYVLLGVSWMAIGWVHHVDRHVSMEALNLRFKGRWKRLAQAVSEVTILIFCSVLVWAGINIVLTSIERHYRSASLLKFPLWIPYTLIPIGGLLLGLVALRRLFTPFGPSSGDSQRKEP
ncbi:TRAP transporter small permease [Allopusillimonas soli]|uniref:TRAP transporter small permease protein n=1 Tax=Allopusillimonas soli TaxID=659016 RepID=A0A853FAA9_9BURK|nr:TRAP transporter small permease [Allopusillimonas soli]NYT37635.1 TRAP transporter small permease [Allopusillimonas soli]TEA74402.1 TRAP transporter small permease [Allopusillimonas soli]